LCSVHLYDYILCGKLKAGSSWLVHTYKPHIRPAHALNSLYSVLHAFSKMQPPAHLPMCIIHHFQARVSSPIFQIHAESAVGRRISSWSLVQYEYKYCILHLHTCQLHILLIKCIYLEKDWFY
jgi:hypothetical protein